MGGKHALIDAIECKVARLLADSESHQRKLRGAMQTAATMRDNYDLKLKEIRGLHADISVIVEDWRVPKNPPFQKQLALFSPLFPTALRVLLRPPRYFTC